MNITFIVKEFPKTSETFILSQVQGLLDRGHNVRVLSLRRPRNTVIEYNSEILKRTRYLGYKGSSFRKLLKVVNVMFSHGGSIDFWRHVSKYPNGLSIVLYPASCSNIIMEADIILIHYGDLAYNFSFLKNKPILVIFHGVDVARYLPALTPSKRTYLWDNMTLGLPVSDFWKERLQEMGCPQEKLRVLHMGVDTERFLLKKSSPSQDIIKLISVGRLVEKKGIDIALQGILKVRKTFPDIKIVYDIVGDGPERQKLESIASSLNINDVVTFHGVKSHHEVKNMLSDADVFILPSRTAANGDMEGIPVSLMEAMACGLPVVSTYHSGIPELVRDGESGLLVEENDADGLTVALGRLVSEPELGPRLGQRARNVVEREFRHDTLMRDLEILFESLGGSHS